LYSELPSNPVGLTLLTTILGVVGASFSTGFGGGVTGGLWAGAGVIAGAGLLIAIGDGALG